MGLNKTVEIGNSGITASYWRVIGIYADDKNREVSVVFEGYRTKEDRDLGKNSVAGAIKTINLSGEDYNMYVHAIRPDGIDGVYDINKTVAYQIAKSKDPDLADAEDVLEV
jgi:hypothetical protein